MCRGHVRRAEYEKDLSGFKTYQVDKARELIEDKGLIPFRKNRKGVVIYQSVSSKGDRIYKTARTAPGRYVCTCPGAVFGGTCYHEAAAEMVSR